MKKVFAVSVVFFAALSSAPVHAFDCNKARTQVEHMICSDNGLIRLDSQMADLYFYLQSNSTRRGARFLLNNQRAWLAARNQCPDTGCLVIMYLDRIRQFKNVLGMS